LDPTIRHRGETRDYLLFLLRRAAFLVCDPFLHCSRSIRNTSCISSRKASVNRSPAARRDCEAELRVRPRRFSRAMHAFHSRRSFYLPRRVLLSPAIPRQAARLGTPNTNSFLEPTKPRTVDTGERTVFRSVVPYAWGETSNTLHHAHIANTWSAPSRASSILPIATLNCSS
jgi:hypothetical protein